MLLHPWPQDERVWERQLEVLPDALTPRLYGRGASIDEWASQILAEVGGELVLVGASMGGYVALSMTRQAPERVRGIALVGSRADDDTAERRAFRDELIEKLRSGWRHPDSVASVDNDELIDAQRAIQTRPPAEDVVARFPHPLLVIVGDRDEVVPVDYARSVAELAPRGRLAVVADAGHLVALDRPGEVNALLLDFVEECRS